jgi:phosphodiesterase/alkaline phosphatase D-like protein
VPATRRQLLTRAAAAGTALAAADPVVAAAARRAPRLAADGTFPQGVVAGVPGERELRLWTRLEGHDRPAWVRLEVARDPDFARVVHRGLVRTSPVRDHTAHVTVRPAGVGPGEELFYRFATRGSSSPVGRVRTARPADSAEPVRIAVFSCQGWQPGFYTAHAAMAREELDLAVCVGDYIYEKTDDTGPRTDTIGRDGAGFAQTLDEYRQKWRLYRSDPDLQAMHAAHPFVIVPDNHETADDSPGHLDGAPLYVPIDRRIRHGVLTFFENVPLARDRREPLRRSRAIRLGRHAELILLDWAPNYVDRQERPTAWLPGEEAWVRQRLSRSTATWKVLGSQKMMMSLDLPYGAPLNPGQWDGVPGDRRALMEHVLREGLRDVVVASGDIHTFFAGQVTTTGRIDGTPAAVEFTTGAITSEPGPEMIFGDDGASLTAGAFALGSNANNPHHVFSHHLHSGYLVLELGADQARATFRAVRSKRRRPSEAFDLARFRVPRGTPVVERGDGLARLP